MSGSRASVETLSTGSISKQEKNNLDIIQEVCLSDDLCYKIAL